MNTLSGERNPQGFRGAEAQVASISLAEKLTAWHKKTTRLENGVGMR